MTTAETQKTSCGTWVISTTVREEAEVAQTVRAAMTMWQEVNDGLRDFAEATLRRDSSRDVTCAMNLAAKVEQARTFFRFQWNPFLHLGLGGIFAQGGWTWYVPRPMWWFWGDQMAPGCVRGTDWECTQVYHEHSRWRTGLPRMWLSHTVDGVAIGRGKTVWHPGVVSNLNLCFQYCSVGGRRVFCTNRKILR